MDVKANGKPMGHKKQTKINGTSLLKPDVMLITKDVMIPVKLPPPPGKLFPTAHTSHKTKLTIPKMKSIATRAMKPLRSGRIVGNNCIEQLPPQVNKGPPLRKLKQDILPKCPFRTLPRSNTFEKHLFLNETGPVRLMKESPSLLQIKSKVIDADERSRNKDAVRISRQVGKPLIMSSKKSVISLLTISTETQSYDSIQSIEMLEALPKLPISIIPSSESESNIRVPNDGNADYVSRNPVANDISENIAEDRFETQPLEVSSELVAQNVETFVEACLEEKSDTFQNKHESLIGFEYPDIITVKESIVSHDCNVDKHSLHVELNDSWNAPIDKLKLKCNVVSNENDRVQTDSDNMGKNITYDYQSSVAILHSSAEYQSTDNEDVSQACLHRGMLSTEHSLDTLDDKLDTPLREPELQYPEHLPYNISHIVDDSSSLQIDKKYSCLSVNIQNSILIDKSDDDEFQTVHDEHNIKTMQSNEQIEIKYSWQIIPEYSEDLEISRMTGEYQEELRNSKQTCTEDLNPSEPIYRYSWQKLTSKYLVGNQREDVSVSTHQLEIKPLVENTNECAKTTINDYSEDCSNDDLTPAGNHISDSHFISKDKAEKKSETTGDTGKIVVNASLNNIISSMLPNIKVIEPRTHFNDSCIPNITSHGDNCQGYCTKSELSRTSSSRTEVSSIQHVIANLNEMVITQKQMLDTHAKVHALHGRVDARKSVNDSVDNKVAKVEMCPSVLHALGNYTVRDIRSTHMNEGRYLFDLHNEGTNCNNLLSDSFASVENPSLVDPNESIDIPNEKIPNTNITPAKLDSDLTRSIDSSSKLSFDVDTDFASILSYRIPFKSSYYSSILTASDNFIDPMPDSQKGEVGNSAWDENANTLLLPLLGYEQSLVDSNWKSTLFQDMDQMIGLSLDSQNHMEKNKDNGNENLEHVVKSTEPSKPRLKISYTEIKEAGDCSSSRKVELLNRLEAAKTRLQESEQQIEANWNLDYSVLNIQESVSDKNYQLPKLVEEHIKDIVKSAEEYLAKLQEQLNDLKNADDQIINTSENTLKNIDETYQLLVDNLYEEINKRRKLVKLETEVFKYEGLAPLRACRQEVDAQIRSTQHLIVLTENMLLHPISFNKERLGKVITATSHMGRIPAVPMPEELPYVTFSPPNEDVKREIFERISCLGCVLRMGPAQFTEVYERPACLQLMWHIVDPEYAGEEQTFIVQKALGEIAEPTSPAFETVYVGPETSCFVRDLPIEHSITLRVGIQVTDTSWSVHRIARTTIPAYTWSMNNSEYLITNGGTIATKITQNISTLLSRSAQFSVNHIIEFKFLETTSASDDEGVGLVFEPGGVNETLKRNGALLITANGSIFMDGEQKLMQLPKMRLGSRIIFTSEKKDEETLRLTIEYANKAVTYDWMVPTPLHFAARFLECNKWNFMVK